MGTIRIRDGSLSAAIEPELGAGLSRLTLDSKSGPCEILRPAEGASKFTDLSMYLMAPWTNRIAGAVFAFAGKTYKLRPDWEDGTAIHGDVKTRAWKILDRTPLSARLAIDSRDIKDPNWPWPYSAEVRYEIDADTLLMELGVRNLGDGPMPAGLGFHPFFLRSPRAGAEEAVRVKVVTRGRYPAAGGIPTGPARADETSERLATGGALGELELDDVFAGFQSPAVISWPRERLEATMACSPNLTHAVVYSPRGEGGMKEWFCVEPISMVTDGFNAMCRGAEGTGVAIVEPGKWLRCSVELQLRVAERG